MVFPTSIFDAGFFVPRRRSLISEVSQSHTHKGSLLQVSNRFYILLSVKVYETLHRLPYFYTSLQPESCLPLGCPAITVSPNNFSGSSKVKPSFICFRSTPVAHSPSGMVCETALWSRCKAGTISSVGIYNMNPSIDWMTTFQTINFWKR